ncbi:hypothetical protein ACX8ZS_19935 [Acinetobacter baumannii]
MKDQYKKVSQKHMLGFMYYLQLLGYVIVRQGMDERSVQESEPKTHAWFYVLLAIAGLRNSPARHG